MPLRLRIFEEWYKQMIRMCLESHKAFGVVLIKCGVEALVEMMIDIVRSEYALLKAVGVNTFANQGIFSRN